MDALSAGAVPGAETRPGALLKAEICETWSAAEARWERLSASGEALAFQRRPWVSAWYHHCAGPGVEPLVAFLADAATGVDLLGLALVRRREGLRRVIAFADDGLTDYNAPLLARRCPPIDGRDLRRALVAALPAADILRLEKMPVAINGRANPLASLPATRLSALAGHVLDMDGGWAEWLARRDHHTRKEIGRRGRRFEKLGDGTFRRYGPGPEAEQAYAALCRLQRLRIAERGLPYGLDAPAAAAFYDTIVRDGLRDGSAVLTALLVGNEIVAALLGIADGRTVAVTRLAMAGPQWAHLSPGRLLITRTLEMLSREGVRSLDLTIGAYPYKRQLGAVPVPLTELHQALTPLGLGEIAARRLRAWARSSPAARALAERLRPGGHA